MIFRSSWISVSQSPTSGVFPQPCFSGNRVLIAYQNGLIVLWDVSGGRILFVGGDKYLQLKDDSRSEVYTNIPDDISHDHLQEKETTALSWASPNESILAVRYVDGDISCLGKHQLLLPLEVNKMNCQTAILLSYDYPQLKRGSLLLSYTRPQVIDLVMMLMADCLTLDLPSLSISYEKALQILSKNLRHDVKFNSCYWNSTL